MEDQLRSAAYNNDIEALQAFIKAGADVNARDEKGWTPLIWASRNGSLDAAEMLVKAGADVTLCTNYGQSALDYAKSPEMRQLFARAWPQDHPLRLHVLAAADLAYEVVDAVIADADVNAHDKEGQTPLFWAAQKNSPAAAKVLIKTGADVNARDKQGQTPFYWAALKNSLAAADVLVKAGADVTLCDNYGQRTLDCAKSPEMRQLLARAWPQDHPLRLHALAKADLADEVTEAVAAGADVTICTNWGLSALDCTSSPEMRQLLARAWPQDHPRRLHALAAADLADEVTEAVAAGADVNPRDDEGWTPLFWAAISSSLAAAEVLVKAGADVTICDNDRLSALDCAKSFKMRQLLARAWPQDHPHRLHALAAADLADEVVDAVAAGADVNARDEKGWTPLILAAPKKSLAVAEVLVKAGADVTIRANNGQSALDRASSPEMRQLLARAWPQDHPRRLHALAKADLADEVADAVAAGTDVNARDEKGRTPIFWAARTNSLAAAEALAKAGADVTIRANNGQSALDRASSPEMRQLLTRARPQEPTAGLYKTVARLLAENADLRAQVKEMQETIRAGAARAAPELEH